MTYVAGRIRVAVGSERSRFVTRDQSGPNLPNYTEKEARIARAVSVAQVNVMQCLFALLNA